MKIGIVYDSGKEEAKRLALEVSAWLKNRRHNVFEMNQDGAFLKDLDFIITFGGDGLILRAANKIADRKMPLIRVNFGHVGFLANIKPKEVFNKLIEVIDNENYIIKKRIRIKAEARDNQGNIVLEKDALNDIVIERVGTRAIACEVLADGARNEYRGDGIIFATRTGSTAYSESAGGPTLINDDKFILRVVSPSNREQLPYLIKPDNTIFKLKMIFGKARLVIDGNEALILSCHHLVIKKSEKETLFIEIGDAPRLRM